MRIHPLRTAAMVTAIWLGASAGALALTTEQELYRQAVQAQERKDYATFNELKSRLQDYVLLPYLEYAELAGQLDDTPRVEAFIRKHADSYLGDRLRRAWLARVATQGRTDLVLRYYKPERDKDNTGLRCHYLHAKVLGGAGAAVLDEVQSLWMTEKALPEACDALTDDLDRAGRLTPELLWERIRLVMKRGNLSVARALAVRLPEDQADLIKLWAKAQGQPDKTLSEALAWPDTARHRDIIVHAVRRMAKSDYRAARERWDGQIKPNFKFTSRQAGEVERELALRAAWRHQPEANELYARIVDDALDEEGRAWRIRAALRSQDWKAVARYVDALPENERRDEQWRYWRARAAEALGQGEKANALYGELARETSYYGFLAAEKLDRPYTINNLPIVKPEEEKRVAELARQPVYQRIRELYALGMENEAYQEWNHELANNLDDLGKRAAARLAHDWGWHFTAIISAGKAKHFGDLALRFPLLYEEQVTRAAQSQALPTSWVYGVIRRESAFRETARSSAGALGLMQLMPATAAMVGKKIGYPKLRREDITEPETNLALGTTYLRGVYDRFNHEALATASYNAGPGRVNQWLPATGELPADIWIDTIVFTETRDYVKAVLFYSTIFDWKLNDGVVRSLGSRLQPVRAVGTVEIAAADDEREEAEKTEN